MEERNYELENVRFNVLEAIFNNVTLKQCIKQEDLELIQSLGCELAVIKDGEVVYSIFEIKGEN